MQTEGNTDGQRNYEITANGRVEVKMWFATPVSHASQTRDELAVKLALVVTQPMKVSEIVQTQRAATMSTLQDLTRMKMAVSTAERDSDIAWILVLESMIFAVEAQVRWLDFAESKLALYHTGDPIRTSTLNPTQTVHPVPIISTLATTAMEDNE